MLKHIQNNLKEAVVSIIPIVIIVMLLSLLIPMAPALMISFLLSSIILIIGTTLFTFGADISMLLIGEKIGNKLVRSKKILIILFVSLIIGIATTVAEPDLRVLADQLTSIPSNLLIIIISVGVGIYMLLSSLRSLYNLDLNMMLLISFIIIFGLMLFVPSDFIPIAFDSGGVTTGTISIPFIMTLGVGLTASRTDKRAKESSFGLVALCSTGPILMVMLMGIFFNNVSDVNLSELVNTNFGYNTYLNQLLISLKDVLFSISPIIVILIIYQLITKEIGKLEMRKIILGIIVIIIGLTLFLMAANVGFMDMGYLIGEYMVNSNYSYLLVPIVMLLAFFIAVAEPAVKILVDKIEEITEGSISKKSMKLGLSLGVSLAAGMAMIRAFTGISFLYFAIPGYVLCLILMFFVPKTFTAIAFDSGGATGGTLTTTFLLPIAIGVCLANDGNILTDAFGLAALVSLIPIIMIQLIGILYKVKNKKAISIEELDESIVDYSWEVTNG